MKKRLVILLALLILLLLFLNSCKITGEAYGTIKTKISPNIGRGCYDSDQGIKEFIKGTTFGILANSKISTSKKYVDYCKDEITLMEYYCRRNKVYSKEITCDFGCQDGACLEELSVIDVDLSSCELLIGDGNPEHLDIIFVPSGFNEQNIQTTVKDEINTIISGVDNSPLLGQQTGFLDLSIIKENEDKINIYLVVEDVKSSCQTDNCNLEEVTAFSLEKCPFFEIEKDMLVNFKNEEMGMAYAVYSENLTIKYVIASPGVGTTFIHEFGHAFAGLNEEYFFSGILFSEEKFYGANEQPSGWGSANCDLNEEPCTQWCEGVDENMYDFYLEKRNLMLNCSDILDQQDEISWQDICPNLNLGEVWGVEKEAETCANLTWYETSIYKKNVCTLNTIGPLKNINFGINCEENTGCYFGCGGGMNAFRSSLFSIMGCGDIDDCSDIYGYASPGGIVVVEPLFPEAIPDFNQMGQQEIQKQFEKYS
jgi:hypothetical protein